jgi:hypothetical protein
VREKFYLFLVKKLDAACLLGWTEKMRNGMLFRYEVAKKGKVISFSLSHTISRARKKRQKIEDVYRELAEFDKLGKERVGISGHSTYD